MNTIFNTQATNPLEEALKLPGAKPTLPISAGKKSHDNAFIGEAHQYWGNFHMQMGCDHALYYTSICPSSCT